MAEWPTPEELAAQLGLTYDQLPADRQQAVADANQAAIEQVIFDVAAPEADPPEPLVPTLSLKRAALLLGVNVMAAPNAPFGIAQIFDIGALYVARENPNYTRLLHGHRQAFGVA